MPYGWRVALVDTYSRDAALRSQALNGLAVFAVSMGALFVVSYLLSGWVLRPVQRAWDQQRRFVSDASHELKTPLAVILANVQILEREQGIDASAQRWVSHFLNNRQFFWVGLRTDSGFDFGLAGRWVLNIPTNSLKKLGSVSIRCLKAAASSHRTRYR